MPLFTNVKLQEGDPAPDFTLLDQNGRYLPLSGLRGKRVVLYFYPKADTPGCTAEACSFRDATPKYPEDVVVLGVSKDSVEDQKKFAQKFGIKFRLLADDKGEVISKYGVGMPFLGIALRKTFLIDRRGRIAKIFGSVEAKTHAADVLEALKDVA